MLPYCQLDQEEHISVKFNFKFKSFDSRKCAWKCRLRNGGHFVSKCREVTLPITAGRGGGGNKIGQLLSNGWKGPLVYKWKRNKSMWFYGLVSHILHCLENNSTRSQSGLFYLHRLDIAAMSWGQWSMLILSLRPANERRCCTVTTYLIGWAET